MRLRAVAISAWLLWMVGLQDAEASEIPATDDVDARFVVPRGARSGRIAGGTALGLGLVSVVSGALVPAMSRYNFEGEWFEKSAYDASFQRRFRAVTPLTVTAITAASFAAPMLAGGVVVEGRALRRVTTLSLTPGWLGVGFLSAGATAALLTPLAPGAFLVISGGLAGVGWIVSAAQLGLNVRAARRMEPSFRQRVYRPRLRITAAAIPVQGGARFALVGAF